MLTKKVSKKGNSTYILLPKDFLDMLDIKIGDEVEIKIENKSIIINPIKKEI